MAYRSHTIEADGSLTLVRSDGASMTIRPAEVLSTFSLQLGTRTAKLAATRTALVSLIQTRLGAENAGTITLDISDVSGKVTAFSVVN